MSDLHAATHHASGPADWGEDLGGEGGWGCLSWHLRAGRMGRMGCMGTRLCHQPSEGVERCKDVSCGGWSDFGGFGGWSSCGGMGCWRGLLGPCNEGNHLVKATLQGGGGGACQLLK